MRELTNEERHDILMSLLSDRQVDAYETACDLLINHDGMQVEDAVKIAEMEAGLI